MSELRSNRITDVAGTASPTIPGSILQVKQGISTTVWTGTATTNWEDTNLSVTITPRSVNSKILINAVANYSSSGTHGSIKIVRNGADFLLNTESVGNRVKSHHHVYSNTTLSTYQINPAAINLLDEPSSTSALTYTVQAATPYNANYIIYLNKTANDTDASYNGRVVSTIIAMEIGG